MPDRRRAWARALFAAAPDAGARGAYAGTLEALAAFLRSEPAAGDFLRDPAVSREKKTAFLASAHGGSGPAEEVFSRFCALLVEKGRSGLVPAIALVYRALADAEAGISRIVLEAAREPEPAAVERIARAWAAASGARSAEADIRIVPELVGGYRLRSGSIRYDYSVAGRLERLRRELARPLGTERGEG